MLRMIETEEVHLTDSLGASGSSRSSGPSFPLADDDEGEAVEKEAATKAATEAATEATTEAALEATPEVYRPVLELLRNAESRWPPTNPNRAKLIVGGVDGGASDSTSSSRRSSSRSSSSRSSSSSSNCGGGDGAGTEEGHSEAP